GEADGAGVDLGAALLFEPVEAAEFYEFAGEDVAQRGKIKNVQRSVIQHLLREGAFRPVGFLGFLGKFYAEVVFEERSEADARAVDELRGEHRVEDAFGAEAAEIVQQ